MTNQTQDAIDRRECTKEWCGRVHPRKGLVLHITCPSCQGQMHQMQASKGYRYWFCGGCRRQYASNREGRQLKPIRRYQGISS